MLSCPAKSIGQKVSGFDQFTKINFEISSEPVDSSNGNQEQENTIVK